MNNTAPISMGILVVAGLFGFIGGALSFVVFDWSFLGALFLAIVIAIIVAIILMLGWREPASGPVEAGTAGVGAGTAPTASTAASAAATRDVADETTAVAVDPQITTDAAMKDEEAKAVEMTDPQVKTDGASAAAAAKVTSSAALPGQDDLAARKGEWKYEGGGAAAEKAPVVDEKLDTPAKVAEASAEMTGGSGDKDYDGDGVIEGENEGAKPEMLTAARDGGADNLKEIKGVGPKMENMLNEMGVYHFDQVAGWSAQEVAWVDANLKGFKGRVSRDGWVDQAKILAAGGDTEFSKKVEKGGVY
ncbi:MAG: hypothetical protein ABJO29_06530 [Yoonia sp.]|uniref:hypothetical protein n=1 Tax=Yoonia sp. TaxID=2212373 RepID=UPI002205AB3D|nr:hypothetical protein K3729_12965 [Rhodobacteraceae bacterium S2214]